MKRGVDWLVALAILGALCFSRLELWGAQTAEVSIDAPERAVAPEAGPATTAADEILATIRKSYVDATALTEARLSEALITGLIQQIGGGIEIAKESLAKVEAPQPGSRSEWVDNRFLLLQLRAADGPEDVAGLRSALEKGEGKLEGVVLDLRGYRDFEHYALVQHVAGWFLPTETLLFSMADSTGQGSPFATQGEPIAPAVPLVVVVHQMTAGVGEVLADVLRSQGRAVLVGVPTAGLAVAFSETSLPEGRFLRVAARRAVSLGGKPMFPGHIIPDITAAHVGGGEAEMLASLWTAGAAKWLSDAPPPPRQTEASLVRGENPDFDLLASDKEKESETLRDKALRVSLDVLRGIVAMSPKRHEAAKEQPLAPSPSLGKEKEVPSRKKR
jgi:hypothetical protein